METIRTETLSTLNEKYKGLMKTEFGVDQWVFWCFAGVFLTMPMGTSPPIIFGVLGAFIWLFSGMAFRVKSFFRQSWFWPVVPFIFLPWIGLLYAEDTGGLGIDYAGKTYYWLFCMALASVCFKKLQPRWLISAFFLGLALNACVGILQFAGVVPPKQGWFSGLTRGYNTLTVYLVLAILICAFYFREAEEWRKRAGIIGLMLLYFFHLIIMEGRTGYLTFILLSPFIVKTLCRKFSTWKFGLLFVLIIGAMYSSPIVKKRVEVTLSQLKYHMTVEPTKAWGREYTVNQDRFYMWYGAVKIFLQHPIIGVGTGAYPVVMNQAGEADVPSVAHPHNNILYMAASYGILGIIAFAWLFGEILRNGWKERDTITGHLVLCTALVIFTNGMFNTTILDAGTLHLLTLAVGLQRALPKFGELNQVHHRGSEDTEKDAFFRLSGDADKRKDPDRKKGQAFSLGCFRRRASS
jgi:O-antigen ligase